MAGKSGRYLLALIFLSIFAGLLDLIFTFFEKDAIAGSRVGTYDKRKLFN